MSEKTGFKTGRFVAKMHPNSLANLKKGYFTSTNQPKKNGRKPSKLKKYIKDNNITHSDISNTIKYLLPLTEKELSNVLLDNNVPMIIRMFARAMVDDIKKGKLYNIMLMLERAFGKPKETREVANLNMNFNYDFSQMSEQDAKSAFIEHMNEIKNQG